jgi:hypothetical protein
VRRVERRLVFKQKLSDVMEKNESSMSSTALNSGALSMRGFFSLAVWDHILTEAADTVVSPEMLLKM